MGEDVTVVGLGNMGGNVAARLVQAGHVVKGHDLDADARRRAEGNGVQPYDTLRAAVAGAAVVFTSLPNSAIARRVWLGADGSRDGESGAGGLVALADAGTVLVELSTIDPDTMRELGAAAEKNGHRVVDCPVSGGPGEALSGTLSLIVGGADDVIDGVEAVLGDLGTILRTGPVGTAKVVKIVNNMMSMGNVLVAAEAFAVGVAAGVDPQSLYDVLAVSGGRSHHFTKRFPKAIGGDFTPGFAMELGEKDLALGVELARIVRVPAPAASTARDMYAVALAEGFGGQDIVALLELYGRWAQAAK